MKKYLLTGFMVVLFGIYLAYQRSIVPSTPGRTPFVNSSTYSVNTSGTTNPAPSTTSSTAPTAKTPAQTTPRTTTAMYKNGTYTGGTFDAYYGYIQVQATIQNGKLTDVQFLQYPNDQRQSIEINSMAMPQLRSEAIAAQSANVDIVSRATDSSRAFIQSLATALQQAKS